PTPPLIFVTAMIFNLYWPPRRFQQQLNVDFTRERCIEYPVYRFTACPADPGVVLLRSDHRGHRSAVDGDRGVRDCRGVPSPNAGPALGADGQPLGPV